MLVRTAGARLLARLPPAGGDNDSHSSVRVLIDPEALAAERRPDPAIAEAATAGIPVLRLSWLMDSVGGHQLAPLAPHLQQASA